MKQSTIKKFKQRWTAINRFQDNELRKISVNEKFRQLSSIIRMAVEMKLDFREDKEKCDVRSRWIFLKRNNS